VTSKLNHASFRSKTVKKTTLFQAVEGLPVWFEQVTGYTF
jgi:hypothetical protein